jgi:DMSO/TMAO reductase YedYZ molybdopterin-dependent catalytic subunit
MATGPLPIEYGAPFRLRIETKPGYNTMQNLRSIELVEDYHFIRQRKMAGRSQPCGEFSA